MNSYAYRTAGYAVKALSSLTRANFRIHGKENIPGGALIFVVNHFTRMETIFLPYYINRLTGRTIWSLADSALFSGGAGALLDRLGTLSTKNPDRDRLMVKTLLTGEAAWIIFPEGRMVKNRKVYDAAGKKGERFMIVSGEGVHPPHTGAATVAPRTEFYRERLRTMLTAAPQEAQRLKELFGIEDLAPVFEQETFIVPVNLTYYPLRARENSLNRLAELFLGEMSGRTAEEIMTEGSMLFSGVDVDIRFGEPVRVSRYLKSRVITADIENRSPIDFDDPIPSRPMLGKTARRIMERYMSAIYQMTTVNHDHIMATLLKYMPHSTIDIQDLKQRAYLAANFNFDKMGIHRHESLTRNQISLLTDDRFGRVSNFLDLACQKGVIEQVGDLLAKVSGDDKLYDFHQIRIENPVAVAANEIEPLVPLQQMLKSLARQPNLRIRYNLRRHLVDSANFSFQRDYARFAVSGESKGQEVGSPFLLKGGAPDLGILLVHGYMAAPLEVRALAEHLAAIGCWVYSPRLRGHGTSPEDLATRRHPEWIESVEEGYAILKIACRRVVIGGFSFGAGLALDLCTRVDDPIGVFAIAPPMKLNDFTARFVPAVNFWNRLMKKINFEAAGRQFVENHPENPHINYSRNPLSGVLEMGRLMDELEPRLRKISIPALIIQSYADPVVHHGGSLKIFKKIVSVDKEYLLVNTERHGIINGPGSARIFAAVEDFIRKLMDRTEAPEPTSLPPDIAIRAQIVGRDSHPDNGP